MERRLRKSGFRPEEIALDETLFFTGNGYIGVRACLEEDVPATVRSIRGTYINAFYDLKPIEYGERLHGFAQEQETMVNVVDVQTVRLFLGDARVTPFEGTLHSFERTLDMARGLSVREMRWSRTDGATVSLCIERMACLEMPELFVIRYRLTSETYDGPFSFESTQNGDVTAYANPDDPRVSQHARRHIRVADTFCRGEMDAMVCETLSSGLTMASVVCHTLDGKQTKGLSGTIKPGETVTLEKWCTFADSRRETAPAEAAVRCLGDALKQPLEHWYARQRAFLDAFWARAGVTIEGNPSLQSAIDFSLFQLLQSTGRDAISNIAAKGLSGEGYEGHYFWDTEIYIFPFFLLTDHVYAKRLLSYRHGILDAARKHARMLGHAHGALYPWRTIAGRECSGYFPSGSAQYHINGDVAHSFAQYWRLTHDLAFMAEKGAEVLIETARLWMDAGHFQDGQFRIDDVTGPDEYTCIVNNNYYTNISARENLRVAVEVCRALQTKGLFEPVLQATHVTEDELAAFLDAAEHMYLPYDEERGIYAQDDTFLRKAVLDLKKIPPGQFPLLLHYHPLFLYRHQVLKQADVLLAHFLYEEGVGEEQMRRAYAYYEPITTHDSSLSPCIHGIMAARLGDMDKAMDYFLRTARMDLDNAHGNTTDGLHTANLGGVYLGIVMGFAGLRIAEKGVSLRPRVPKGMDGYSFSFLVGESRIHCRVTQAGCAATLLEGPAVRIAIDGRETLVGA